VKVIRKIVVPKMGLILEKVVVRKWLRREGESFKKGEPLLEIEADKAAMEIEAPFSGSLVKILAREGEEVPILSPVAEAEVVEE
jgi:pyruvate dehydrogenase E2 component (dihydrolipoamide acetyltransferase)